MKNEILKISKKNSAIVIILIIMMLVLTGCKMNDEKVKIYDKQNNNDIEINNGLQNVKKEEDTISSNSGNNDSNGNIDERNNKKTVVGVSSGYVDASNGYEHSLVLTGYDSNGNTIWTYKTGNGPITELETVELLHVGNNRVYINCSGTIQVLNKQTGKLIWENSDYKGASTSFDFDSKDNLYLSGYYGPFLCVIDFNGKTLYRAENEKYIWTSSLDIIENTINIYCAGDLINEDEVGMVRVELDLQNYSIIKVQNVDN